MSVPEEKDSYSFILPGIPVAQGRPRFSTAPGFVVAYDPAKSKDYKKCIAYMASLNGPSVPLLEPVRLSLRIFLPIPKSFSKKKHEEAEEGSLRPTKKPDISNVLKGVEDAMKGIMYADDSQIIEYGTIGKWYSAKPRIEVEVERIGKRKG